MIIWILDTKISKYMGRNIVLLVQIKTIKNLRDHFKLNHQIMKIIILLKKNTKIKKKKNFFKI